MGLHLTLDEIERLAVRALGRAGASEAQAAPVARSIRAAEAEGGRGLGLGYLPLYCRHVEIGKVNGAAVPTVSQPCDSAISVDAAEGFAHPAYEAGEDALVEAAERHGIATLGIRGSYACGVVGYFTDRLARRGKVALAFANASASMAPWGGTRPFFGTNPWALRATATRHWSSTARRPPPRR